MQEPKGEVVLILTVVLDDGQEVIEVREHDVPSALAEEFCKAQGLDASMVPSMTMFIEQQIKESEEPKGTGLQIKLKPATGNHAGERLYKKAIERKAAEQALLSQMSENLIDPPLDPKEYPFKPTINKLYKSQTQPNPSQDEVINSSPPNVTKSSYRRLYEEAKVRKDKAMKVVEEQ